MSIRCYYCGGSTEPRLVSDLYAEDGIYLAVEQVPADVCRQCGERFYRADVTDHLVELTAQAKRSVDPGSRAHVLIYDFHAGAAVPVTAGVKR